MHKMSSEVEKSRPGFFVVRSSLYQLLQEDFDLSAVCFEVFLSRSDGNQNI